ncbi:MAG: response regulator transcription factor [Chloroflexota bacterium]|nr:response regulator transcription factor [Chloroflexota bacterium]
MRILLVEDEPKIAAFIRKGLREESYAVDVAADGEQGLDYAISVEYDLIILDILLPKLSGLELCRELRQSGITTPVLMLTALDTVDNRVDGLDSGGDDYLVKPFALKELLARLRALARRPAAVQSTVFRLADLQVDMASHTVARAGRPIELSLKEYSLLELLLRNTNRVITRAIIAEHVWDEEFTSESNIVDVYIRNLRRKIDDEHALKLIHTVRGVGYKLSEGTAEG